MRFVKNLIATAALAALAAGLPAGGNNNQPDDTLGKKDIIVPGATTTAEIPLKSTPGAVITTGSNMISEPLSRFESITTGSDMFTTPVSRFVTITTGSDMFSTPLSRFDAEESSAAVPVVFVTVTVTESSAVPTGRVSVTAATIIEPHPGVPTTAGSGGAREDYLIHPPTSPNGGHPHPDVEARQMLPITSSVTKRQMLPISSSLAERQMLPISSPTLSERQMLPITSSLAERQMLPISSPTLSQRQMLPITSSLAERQMLPISSPTLSQRQMLPITSSLAERQMLPISSPTLNQRQMLPISSPTINSRAGKTTPAPDTPFGRQPDLGLARGDVPPVNSPTTITTTTCSRKSCATYTYVSTAVVTPSSSTYTGGPSTGGAVRDQDPTFSVDPSDLPTMPPVAARDEQDITLTASYTITITELPASTTEAVVTKRDQDPTFSVDPSDLPTMPPKLDEQSITLTASYTITITELPTSTQEGVVTKRDQDPTFSVDPSDLPTMPPARDQDPTFSVDPSDLPTMPPKVDEQSITLTASYTITITEVPIAAGSATALPEAGPVEPKGPFSGAGAWVDPPIDRHTYSYSSPTPVPVLMVSGKPVHPTGRPQPTTLVTSLVRSAV
ncbi:hypothetical protein KVR01_007129 [Diaporthe batatas]|uniref:uncharacterized protein n=1 Tax=Diaporthe batatas TaxID=748121 RepID=UPI001D045CE6|nr:uncharacterized protein KVR01_007129 [Diaporthe batatas]KAG8162651.1 hypothetical protein KVR01_007129 [Diaporthe batatas]